MNQKDISIATITLARDEQEEALLRLSLKRLATLAIPVFITDGGSPPAFIDFLRSFPHFIVSDTVQKGVWHQAKESLLAAHQHGSKFIFYTEPDKQDFFTHSLPAFFSNLTINDHTGIITVSRSPESFATFPLFQQMTETAINHCCAEIIKQNVDFTYGPVLLNSRLIPYLQLVNEDVGWGWRPYIFNIALRLGYTIDTYEGEFECPAFQQKDNPFEKIYRMKQLAQNIQGLVLSTNVELKGENFSQ